MAKKLSHINDEGKAKMVDVGNKEIMHRTAIAEGKIFMSKDTLERVTQNKLKKGDVLSVAQIAGIQAAKKTSELIPLCHPLIINFIDVHMVIGSDHIMATAIVKCDGKTGIEMEAITAVQIALVTVYDMCKAVDKGMVIGEVRLCKKTKTAIKA